MLNFQITPCDIAEIITETNRFLFHIALVHITSCIIDGNEEFFGAQVIKTLFITAVAIILYHIICKKIVEPKLKKIKTVCEDEMIEKQYKHKVENEKSKRTANKTQSKSPKGE